MINYKRKNNIINWSINHLSTNHLKGHNDYSDYKLIGTLRVVILANTFGKTTACKTFYIYNIYTLLLLCQSLSIDENEHRSIKIFTSVKLIFRPLIKIITRGQSKFFKWQSKLKPVNYNEHWAITNYHRSIKIWIDKTIHLIKRNTLFKNTQQAKWPNKN